MPTDQGKKKQRVSSTTLHKTVSSRICTKYDKVYEDGPSAKRVVYIKKKTHNDPEFPYDTTSISPSICGFLKDCTEAVSSNNNQTRLIAGRQPAQIVNIVPSLSMCHKKQPEKMQVLWQGCVQPTVIHVQLKETGPGYTRRWENCTQSKLKERKRPHKMNRGTQTLYRESSAQTLPYLPEVKNDKETLETLELFKLPKILKGDGPPGLYEVEILERARKRWAFEKAIKREFECKMKEARTQLARKKQFLKHKHIMEAFEWEHWLQREEAIQSYQMMRFKLVICIFERREREMHAKSNLRISMACKEIAEKRDKALKQSEIDFGRQMRRMKIEHERLPRNWRKEKISYELGDPSSEYYGPQMRYGVNPNRRHFQLSRKAFEMRMEDLEKRVVNMKNLECPFAKLKQWSKPKEKKPEIEQNFCTDTNLKKLYESLKGLREHSKKQKIIPKCLKEKPRLSEVLPFATDEVTIESFEFDGEEETTNDVDDEAVQVGASFSQNSLIEMFSQRDTNEVDLSELLDERRREELEVMLAEYEGTKIGWLMRFLSEEMGRLQEQRKLHFITMLAQKERWRREAAEAGLRQKENEMRRIYEDIFDETDRANVDVCEQYLDNIFGIDTREQADFEAVNTVTGLAKVIDADLQRWLCSFQLIQHPLNYDDLRCLLRDLVFPENMLDCLVRRYEATSCVDYIIDDVLFPTIYTLLEPFDIVSPLTNEMIDRLIDNDLYLFSSECSSSCDCGDICECAPEDLEAKAILRKLIRQAVPGRRWRTFTERICDNNVRDIVDSVCDKVTKRCSFTSGARKRRPTVTGVPSELDLLSRKTASQIAAIKQQWTSAESTAESSRVDTVTIVKYRKDKQQARDSCTKSLTSVHGAARKTNADTMVTSGSILMNYKNLQSKIETDSNECRPSILKKIQSAYDIHANVKADSDISSESTDEMEEIQGTHRHTRRPSLSFVKDICKEVIHSLIPPFETDKGLGKETGDDRLASPTEEIVSTDLEMEGTIQFEGEEMSYLEFEGDLRKRTSEHTMVLYEGELKRILEDDDECKCQMEIDYKNHIRELFETGQIKLIYREPRLAEEDGVEMMESDIRTVDLSEMVFEYTSSTDKAPVDDDDYYIAQEEIESEDFNPLTELTDGVELGTTEINETVTVDATGDNLAAATEATAKVPAAEPAEANEPIVDAAEMDDQALSAEPVDQQEAEPVDQQVAEPVDQQEAEPVDQQEAEPN